MIEVNASRETVRRLTGRTSLPQLLIRVGALPYAEPGEPPTPRRPVTDVLEILWLQRNTTPGSVTA